MTQLNSARVECVCGDYYGSTSGSLHGIVIGVEDFWKKHMFCKKGDESLEAFEKSVEAIGKGDLPSHKLKYVARRVDGLDRFYAGKVKVDDVF